MFSVYGITGQVFSGTLEEMSRVYGLGRTRTSNPIEREDANWQLGNSGIAGTRHREKAVQAYRAMLPRDIERGPLYHAGQIMQREVICVGVNDDVGLAWSTLQSNNIRQAPVLDDAAHLVGIVAEHDLLAAFNIDTGKLIEVLRRRVEDVMSTPVITAQPVTDIRRIAAAMLAHRIDGVPVTGDLGRLVG